MSAVIPFRRPATRSDSWSQQELAEFYRVEAALLRAGIGIASEHGVSDEGEPWFVFCRPDGDAIMHFARIDGSYLIASEVLDHPVRGADFRTLIDQIARLHPDLLPIPAVATGTKLVVHPAALLAALVAAAALSLSSEEAHAGEIAPGLDPVASSPPAVGGGTVPGQPPSASARGAAEADEHGNGRRQVEAIILSTMIFAAEASAGDRAAAGADLGPMLADLASGIAYHGVQGDPALGTGGGIDAVSAAASVVQPTVLTAQGSGANQDAASTGVRIDPAPVIRADLPGDGPGPHGRQAETHASHVGNDVGLARAATEIEAPGTGGQQASTTNRDEGVAGSSAGPDTDGGDPRGNASQSALPDSSAQPRLAETARADAGSGTSSQAWVPAAGQAEAYRSLATSASRETDDRGSDRGQVGRADAAADGPNVGRAEHAHGGAGHDAQAPDAVQMETGPGSQGSGHGDHGSPLQKAALESGSGSQADPGTLVHVTGPAEQSEGRAPAARDVHTTEHGSGPGTPAGDAGQHPGSAPNAPSSHASVALAASSQGPEKTASDQEPSGGHGPSSGHGSGDSSGAGADHAASPSSGSPHDGLDNAHGQTAAPDNAAASTPQHTASEDTGQISGGGPASRGQGLDANHGSPVHNGGGAAGAQDHPGPDMPSGPAAQTGSGGHGGSDEASPQPEHDTSSSAVSSQAAPNHGIAAGPPASQGGASASANPDRGQVNASDPAAHRVDPGSHGGPPEKPASAEAQHPSNGSNPVQAATLPPPGPAEPAPPRAAIDPNGNLVFHGDNHHDGPSPTAAHSAGDPGASPTISLVGVSDHGHVVHDLYHQS